MLNAFGMGEQAGVEFIFCQELKSGFGIIGLQRFMNNYDGGIGFSKNGIGCQSVTQRRKVDADVTNPEQGYYTENT